MSQPNRSTAVQNTKKRGRTTEDQHQHPPLVTSDPKKLLARSKVEHTQAKNDPEEPMTEEERLVKREKQILVLRHRLQKGLLSRNQAPQEDGMSDISRYLGDLEAHDDLEREIMEKTKVHKVLKAIIKLDPVPKEQEQKFKQRCNALLEQWDVEPGEPVTLKDANRDPLEDRIRSIMRHFQANVTQMNIISEILKDLEACGHVEPAIIKKTQIVHVLKTFVREQRYHVREELRLKERAQDILTLWGISTEKRNGDHAQSAIGSEQDDAKAKSKPANNETPTEPQRGTASEANEHTARALALIDRVEQEVRGRSRARGVQPPAPLDRLRARILAANGEVPSSSRPRIPQGDTLVPATEPSSGHQIGPRQGPASQLQLLQNRAEYEPIIDHQANGHQEMLAATGWRAKKHQDATGVHPFNLPVEDMDDMIDQNTTHLHTADSNVDMVFSTAPIPSSVQRAQAELARIDHVRAQMVVNEAERNLSDIQEAESAALWRQDRMARLNTPQAELDIVALELSRIAGEVAAGEEKVKQAEQKAKSLKDILDDLTQKLEAAEEVQEPPAKRRRT